MKNLLAVALLYSLSLSLAAGQKVSAKSSVEVEIKKLDPKAYRENLFKLLGDQNPLEVLARTASTFKP
jgi:hypothetical protein